MRGGLARQALLAVAAILFVVPLSAAPRDCAVAGAVRSSGGAPVARVWVSIKQGGKERGRALTGDDGKYYIGNLDAGAASVEVLRGTESVFSGQVTLSPGRTSYDISLP